MTHSALRHRRLGKRRDIVTWPCPHCELQKHGEVRNGLYRLAHTGNGEFHYQRLQGKGWKTQRTWNAENPYKVN